MSTLINPFWNTAAAGASYQSLILADSPLGYWRLGETSGIFATDLGSGGNTGTYSGTYTLGNTGGIFADSDPCLTVGGAGYVNLQSPASLDITGDITMECWVNLTSQPASGLLYNLFSAGYDGTTVPWFIDIWNNVGVVQIRGGSFDGITVFGKTYTLGAGELVGSWNHVLVRYLSGAWSIFLNGTSVGTLYSNASGSVAGHARTVRIANLDLIGSNDRFLDGKIDEVAIWASGLTDAQILAHYNRGAFGT